MGPLQKSKSPIQGHPTPALSSLSSVSSSSMPLYLLHLSLSLSRTSHLSHHVSALLLPLFLAPFPSLISRPPSLLDKYAFFATQTQREKSERSASVLAEGGGLVWERNGGWKNVCFFLNCAPFFFFPRPPLSLSYTSSDKVRWRSPQKWDAERKQTREGCERV